MGWGRRAGQYQCEILYHTKMIKFLCLRASQHNISFSWGSEICPTNQVILFIMLGIFISLSEVCNLLTVGTKDFELLNSVTYSNSQTWHIKVPSNTPDCLCKSNSLLFKMTSKSPAKTKHLWNQTTKSSKWSVNQVTISCPWLSLSCTLRNLLLHINIWNQGQK